MVELLRSKGEIVGEYVNLTEADRALCPELKAGLHPLKRAKEDADAGK